jgi:hypothetical protein
VASVIEAREEPAPRAIARSPFADHEIEVAPTIPRCLNCKTAQPEGAVTCKVCGLRQPGAKADWLLLALILIGIAVVAALVAFVAASLQHNPPV